MKNITRLLEVMRSITIIAIVAIIGLAFFACPNSDGTTEQPKARMDNQPAQTLTFTGATGTYSVTVKSADLYLDADWTTTVAKVITAIERGYNKNLGSDSVTNKEVFDELFATSNNVVITLSNSAAHNCEVKTGEYNKITLKTSSLSTVDIQPAAWIMYDNKYGANNGYTAQATPLKDVHIITLAHATV